MCKRIKTKVREICVDAEKDLGKPVATSGVWDPSMCIFQFEHTSFAFGRLSSAVLAVSLVLASIFGLLMFC